MQVDAELGEISNEAVEPDQHHFVAALKTNRKGTGICVICKENFSEVICPE